MLNYMGPNFGPAPVSAMLPPATPGTIPSGVPGVSPNPAPLPPAPPIHAPAVQGKVSPHGAAIAAILRHANTGLGAAPPPPPPEYGTTTQEDGSILLHIKGPNGALGPVVKVLPPIKTPGAVKA